MHEMAAVDPESERVLTELAALLAAHGPGDFVFAPLVTPEPSFFPDAWRGDLRPRPAST